MGYLRICICETLAHYKNSLECLDFRISVIFYPANLLKVLRSWTKLEVCQMKFLRRIHDAIKINQSINDGYQITGGSVDNIGVSKLRRFALQNKN